MPQLQMVAVTNLFGLSSATSTHLIGEDNRLYNSIDALAQVEQLVDPDERAQLACLLAEAYREPVYLTVDQVIERYKDRHRKQNN